MLQYDLRDERCQQQLAFRIVHVLLGALVCICHIGVSQDLLPTSVLQPVYFSANSGANGAVSLLFADGFENGDTLAWSATHTGVAIVMIFGTLTDAETGFPLEGIEIQFFDQSDEALNSAVLELTTGPDGTFGGEIATGAYFIGAYPPAGSDYARAYFPGVPPYYDPTGWEGWKPTSIAGVAVDVSFSLSIGGKIEVQLLGQDGNPYAGALIPGVWALGDGACGSGCIVGTYYLDLTSGFVETPLLPPGNYIVTFSPETPLQPQSYCGAFEISAAEVITLHSGEVLRLPDCSLAVWPTVGVSGRVTSDQGVPIGGVVVSFVPFNSVFNSGFVFTTDSAGGFSGAVNIGNYFIEYQPPVESCFPVVRYPGPPPHDDLAGLLGWQPVAVTADNHQFDVVIPRGGRFQVSIQAPDGAPNSDPVTPVLHFIRKSPCDPVDCVGIKATYTLGVIESDLQTPWTVPGDYVLGFSLDDSGAVPSQFYCGTLAADFADVIHLDSGDELVLPACTLVTSRPTYAISGRVTNASGDPVANVQIIAEPRSSDAVEVVTSSGENGTYELEAKGSYHTVRALPETDVGLVAERYPNVHFDQYFGSDPFSRPVPTLLSVDQDYADVDFELERGGRFHMQVKAPDGTPNSETFSPHLFLVTTSPCNPEDCRNQQAMLALDEAQAEFTTPWVLPGDYLLGITFDQSATTPSQYFCGTLAQDLAELIHLDSGDDIVLQACNLITSGPSYTISGLVTDNNGYPVENVQIIAEPQSGDATKGMTLSGEDGTYLLQAEGSYHTVRAIPDSATWLAGEWYPDAHCSYYLDDMLIWKPMYTYLTAGQDYLGINFELERGGVIELEGLLGSDQSPIGFPVSGAVTYLHRADEIDEFREDHAQRNYLQICGYFETDELGRVTTPVIPDHGYLLTFGFPSTEAGYINQGYCRVPDQQLGDYISVVEEETTLLSECELISDEYRVRTSEGTMFSFDEMWSEGEDGLYGFAEAADLNNDGLNDFILAGVSESHGSDCPPGTTFGTGIMVFINQGGNHFEDQTEHWTDGLNFGFCNGLSPGIADLDGDGFQDLVLVGSSIEWADRPWGQQDEVWRNVDGDHFESKTGDWIPLDNKPGADGFVSGYFQLGDLDADGDIDLVRTMDSEGGQILLNDGSGRLVDVTSEQNQIDPGVIPYLNPSTWGVDLTDIDVDGHLDILFLAHDGEATHLRAILGRGDGFFELPEPEGLLLTPFPDDWIEDHADLEAVDLDGDGLPEIYLALELLVSSGCIDYYTTAVCRTNELDRLFSVNSIDEGVPTLIDVTDRLDQSTNFNKSHRVRSADIDIDGDIDLVVSNFAWGIDQVTHPEIRVLINDGFGNMSLLEKEAFPSFTASAGDVVLFDSDNDGDLDLLLCGSPVVLLVNKTISPE